MSTITGLPVDDAFGGFSSGALSNKSHFKNINLNCQTFVYQVIYCL